MSDFSLTLVLHFKTSKNFNGMAKVQIKSEKITPFGGIFHVREQFSRFVGPVIDKVLGLRCTSYGYQYSEIAGSLASVYFCGGNCVEDITSHLMPHLSLHPSLRTCSSDTVLRAISELATGNTTYTSDTGKSYEFNTATKLNSLLVQALLSTGQLVAGASYDLDFDHQFIETEKYDAKMTYKKFTGYSPLSPSLWEGQRFFQRAVESFFIHRPVRKMLSQRAFRNVVAVAVWHFREAVFHHRPHKIRIPMFFLYSEVL